MSQQGVEEETAPAWPRVTRLVQNHHLDSANWEGVTFRPGDVVVGNWAKSGITWVQQIACQLIHDGSEDAQLIQLSLWPEWQTLSRADAAAWSDAAADRRIFKTHLPADALPISPLARYLYVARDPRDVVWSLHAHHLNCSDALYQAINSSPKLKGPRFEPPDPDIRRYYDTWLAEDGAPYWPFWSHIQSWWDVQDLPNVMLLHFHELKADLEGRIRAIAAFLDVEIDPETWPAIVEHCGFDWMKARGATLVSSTAFADVSKFVNAGVNGRWRDVLSAEQIARCEAEAARNLSPGCAKWLMRG